MSIQRLPSGRWRSQVYHQGRNVTVGTFDTKREAKAAREDRRRTLTESSVATVATFRERWLTDPLFAWPKQSTAIHNRQQTKHFAERYGALPLDAVGDQVVGEWLAGGKRNGTVPALRAMFNAAASAKAGRLVQHNPFARLGIKKGRGNADKPPPPETMVWELIAHARGLAFPAFSAWLQVAAFTGMRPGELDALRWSAVDLERGRIAVNEQWSATSRTFTLPKNGLTREAILTPPAREALVALARESEWCFTSLRGSHFTPSMRAYHWKAIRSAAGYTDTLYLATRHFAGWYMVNVLELASEDVAIALGHEDSGELVRRLYGHRDRERALGRVADAYAKSGKVTPLRVVRKDAG